MTAVPDALIEEAGRAAECEVGLFGTPAEYAEAGVRWVWNQLIQDVEGG